METRRLILFDIDGTLLLGGRLWRECFEGAFRHCFPEIELRHVTFNGKTDPQICRELLGIGSEQGCTSELIEARVRGVIDEYLDRVEKNLPHRKDEVTALPGIHQLLERLSTMPGVQLGLLTGNVRRGAKIKLGAAGLDRFFDFGAFGDDHWDRYRLPEIAAERAKHRFGIRFVGKEIVVIGDTIHDVNCGKSIGVRSIAVGTGRNVDRAELLAARPDHFFEDLSSTEEVLRALLSY